MLRFKNSGQNTICGKFFIPTDSVRMSMTS